MPPTFSFEFDYWGSEQFTHWHFAHTTVDLFCFVYGMFDCVNNLALIASVIVESHYLTFWLAMLEKPLPSSRYLGNCDSSKSET
jgi:hypothetical protein